MSGDLAAAAAPFTAGEAEVTDAPSRRADAQRLCRQLQLAGVELITPHDPDTAVGGGVPLDVAAGSQALLPDTMPRVREASLSDGHSYVLAAADRFRSHENTASSGDHDRFWAGLWQRQAASRTHLMLAPDVMPQCPLLSVETATAILPALGIQVPPETSWLVMRLDVTRFADAQGVLQETVLEQALHSCVDAGDALHDAASWPTSAMRQDASLNRRLAIQLTGLGDLVELRRIDPCHVEALKNLDELLRWARSTLQARSHLIAKSAGRLPAIEQSDPSRLLPCAVAREDWRQRWRHTADETAVRHRNLLVLSPWSIFPTRHLADYRYADLLPILLHADACAVQRSVSLAQWNINEFKRFNRRAWAVLQQRCAATLIAKGV